MHIAEIGKGIEKIGKRNRKKAWKFGIYRFSVQCFFFLKLPKVFSELFPEVIFYTVSFVSKWK